MQTLPSAVSEGLPPRPQVLANSSKHLGVFRLSNSVDIFLDQGELFRDRQLHLTLRSRCVCLIVTKAWFFRLCQSTVPKDVTKDGVQQVHTYWKFFAAYGLSLADFI
jgi:hypothetical protein